MSVASTPQERERRWYRERIATALEMFEAGDQWAAVDTLLVAMDGPGPTELSHACEHCGARFEWPGLVEAHVYGSCTAYPMAA